MSRLTCLRFFWPAAAAAATFATFSATAQPARLAPATSQIERRADGRPELISYERATAPTAAEAPAALRAALELSAQNELRASKPAETDDLGFTHQKYQQFYQGVPVEFTAYTTHVRDGKVEFMTGETRAIADGALDVRPTLTAAAALARALTFVGARQYQWELPNEGRLARETEDKPTFRPTGELVIVDNGLTPDVARHGRPVLAWKFNVYAAQPLSRAWIYVDARTGEVVNQDAIIKHATGSFATKYSGIRQLSTTYSPILNAYNLVDATRGLGIETYNANRQNIQGGGFHFFDLDNNWTAAEHNNARQDWVAGDAHFGAQQAYDYWKIVHGRNSYDNAGAKIKSYVHVDPTPGDGVGWSNASWNGFVMSYGDGSSTKPLTTLDICAHELGHAVCGATANLKYENESGALNEGFSDIWAACVEQRAVGLLGLTGKSTWLIGEELTTSGTALRSMSNPNLYGHPDTYLDVATWRPAVAIPMLANDFGGVHSNSGVLNYWFYLLSQGGSGTNDRGNAYSVSGLGILKAAKIAYFTERNLSPLSNFASARNLSIYAAKTLYGAGSAEERAVTNAWYAVGIGGGIAFGNAPGTSVVQRYIDLVAFGTLMRSSGADNGYFDGTVMAVPNVARCAAATIGVSAGSQPDLATLTQYWNVYVDFNHDQDFNDAGERLINNHLLTTTAWWTNLPFTMPATAPLGSARVRVIMTSSPCARTNGYVGLGEVEDYVLNVTAALPVAVPFSLQAIAIAATRATLNWAAVAGAASYNVQYRPTTRATWTTVTVTGPTHRKLVTGLSGGQMYLFQVQAVNACGTAGAYSGWYLFTTPVARPAGTPSSDSLTTTTGTTLTAARTLALPATAATLTATAYPNPAHDVLRLTLTDARQTAQAVTSVDVFDQRGARVLTTSFDAATSTLRIAALRPGLYSATARGATSAARPVRFVKE